jgi:hypothetical protein
MGELVAAVGHEVNNSLNGIAVNLAVVSSRLDGGASADRVVPFAAKATAEFEAANQLVQSIVALARPVGVLDAGRVVRPLAAVAGAVLARYGQAITLDIDEAGSLPSIEVAQAVRLVVGSALLTTVRERVSSRLIWKGREVRFEAETTAPLVDECMRGAGIELRESADGVTLTLL